MKDSGTGLNRRWKTIAQGYGILILAWGLLFSPFGMLWLAQMVFNNLSYGDNNFVAQAYGMVWLSGVLISVGGGGALFYHANRSLSGQPSRPVRLPPFWMAIWGLLLLLFLGEILRRSLIGGLFFPPVFLVAGLLPPLGAFAWAIQSRAAGETISWRQFLAAFILGSTVSVLLAIGLEILLPFLVVALVEGLFGWLQGAWEGLVAALAGEAVSQTLTSRGFLVALIELGLVAPLVEEFCKPLVVVPLLARAGSPRQAFLIGAAAGAGFAGLENLLYTGFGHSLWGGVVAVRAIGAAVHPLGSGLVALGWYLYFHSEAPEADRRQVWLARFGLAAGLHALWNGGSLLLLALIRAQFFGLAPAGVDLLGLTLSGVLLLLLLVAGGVALFGLRVAPGGPEQGVAALPLGAEQPAQPADRLIAIWALLCLIVTLPLGLAALRLLGGGR